MLCIYIGDASNVVNRILTNHCSGNVEGSALRKAVAEAMGYHITRTRRQSGSTRIRIDLPNPREGESRVSEYIRSGNWRYIICLSYNEAHDFQYYMIDQLKPLLNRKCEAWNTGNLKRYEDLFNQLEKSSLLNYSQLRGRKSGHGAYVLYYEQKPS